MDRRSIIGKSVRSFLAATSTLAILLSLSCSPPPGGNDNDNDNGISPAVLAGDWETTDVDGATIIVRFDAEGIVEAILAEDADGMQALILIEEATTEIEGDQVTITIPTPEGARGFIGTLSEDQNTLDGVVGEAIQVSDTITVVIPQGDATFTRIIDGGGNDNDNDNDNDNGDDRFANYVGSDRCADCHGDIYDDFVQTGHPFKLNAVPGSEAPEYPITTLPGPPDGLEWDDLSYVIGGFRYKYRVVDNDGFIVLGPTAQYNFPSQSFGSYNNDDDHTDPDGTPGPWGSNIGRKPYNCGKCHTTAYDVEAPAHEGLPGMVGDWAFAGIQCEECHGPGADHVNSLSADDINGNPQTDVSCAKCHVRSPDGIAASGGFVRHHEQYDEYSRTKHGQSAVFADGCMTCHDPHKPIFDSDRLDGIQALFDADGADSTLDELPSPPGIIRECTDCHGSVTVAHEGPTSCKTCHMAFTVKTAVATGPNSADIRSHAWLINSDPEAQAFTDADGNPVDRDDPNLAFSALNDDGNPFITLDFACLRCHADQDLQWAADNAAGIHEE